MAFRPISRNSASRYLTAVSNFAGVDYASQRFKVASNHAIDLLNFYYKDGVIQKRQGFEELIEVEETHYIPYAFDNEPLEYNGQNISVNPDSPSGLNFKTNTRTFNGIWSITGEDKKTHIIAHIGHIIYEILDIDKPYRKIVPIVSSKTAESVGGDIYYYAYEFLNQKTMGFVGANRFYFLGGNKFMCLRFLSGGGYIFYPIENHSETYIPTTTMAITYKNSFVSGRESLDKVNLMTMWRKNELLSGTLKNEDEKTQTDYYDYTLDAPIITNIDENDNAIVEESKMSNFRITLIERGTIE